MRNRLSRGLSIGVAALFLHSLLAGVAPTPTYARVDPLTIIKRQIHKPNMLVLLDTSGSLTGVPGGTFDTSDEVGVDCDDGVNCRGGVSQGLCSQSGKACINDDQCRSSTCFLGTAECSRNEDCQPVAGKCTTGENCFAAADCPALDRGHCRATSTECSSTKKCTVQKRCQHNGNVCATDTDCALGVCGSTTTGCRVDADCPYGTSGGTCAYLSTPAGGCAKNGDCPVRAKVCSDNPNLTCTTVNDCGGTCKKNGTACATNNDCKKKPGDSCDFTGKTCASPVNSCLFPRLTCTIQHAQNTCSDINTCAFDSQSCSGVQENRCVAGSEGEQCNASSGGSGGSRMCRIGQMKCTRDSDCTIAGDSCGPATSRFVIAKRVIRNIVSSNAQVVNLGLMTFFQDGYFPYYKVTAGSTSTQSTELKHGTLMANKCYSKKIGLQSTCTVNGKSYTLRAHNNTRYLVKGAPGDDGKYVDVNYCGYFCNIPGVGTGIIKGAYYEYLDIRGATSTLTTFSSYRGRSFTEAGISYQYYTPRADYYNGGTAPPIEVPSCGTTCGAECGARWDEQLAPMLTTNDDAASVEAVISAFDQAMEPAADGGLISYGGTPIGCSLENSGAETRNRSAYHYMQAVKASDTLACRQNYVLLITDGEANGPGDSYCTRTACSAEDPVAAGCQCRAVTAAYRLRKNLGVKTFVVGFAVDAAAGNGRIINDNIAKAGGTDAGEDGAAPYAFGAISEQQLHAAIQGAIYQAVKGSYSTSPSTASQGGQAGASLHGGTMVIDARADFPSWKGHLLAYDVTGERPVLSWDASTLLDSRDWRTRRVYTSDAENRIVPIEVDYSSGRIRNADKLHELGLGATVEEADRIGRFALGDPLMKNPSVLGAFIGSTPIDVAQPPDGSLPGAHEFHLLHRQRPSLVYVGSSDGMLHAFMSRTVQVGGVTYEGGREMFAFIPRSMLPVVSKRYAQGGQLADPNQHLFGLATSPKVKNVCVANCTSKSATWKTVLMMSQGWGGNYSFALDVTDPFASATQPIGVLWSTDQHSQSSEYTSKLGLTVSVPAYTFKRSDSLDDHRLLMTSAYPVDSSSSTQGHSVLSIRASTGAIVASATIRPEGSCTQEFAFISDVATSRQQVPSDNGALEGRKELIAGYLGDTWGNLWQYDKEGAVSQIGSFGCNHPLHNAPTVVQLDQDDPMNPHAGDIYLVQVTNSTLDRDTETLPSSRMMILRQRMVEGRPTLDTTFGSNGVVTLTAGNSTELCAVSDATGQTCLTPLSADARPLSSPMALPKADGAGFTIMSNWYQPPNQGCGKGSTYFLMHEIAGATVTLRQALKVADEPVVSPIVAAGKLMVTGSSGPINIGGGLTTTIMNATAPSSHIGDLFQSGGWSEVE